jgi:hypothetical protein
MALFGERIVSAKDMLDHYMEKAIPVLPAKIENSEQHFLLTCDQKLLQTWSEEFVTQIDEIKNARAAFHVANNQIPNAQQRAQHELDFTTLMSANDITLYLRRAGTKLNEIRTAQDKLDAQNTSQWKWFPTSSLVAPTLIEEFRRHTRHMG